MPLITNSRGMSDKGYDSIKSQLQLFGLQLEVLGMAVISKETLPELKLRYRLFYAIINKPMGNSPDTFDDCVGFAINSIYENRKSWISRILKANIKHHLSYKKHDQEYWKLDWSEEDWDKGTSGIEKL